MKDYYKILEIPKASDRNEIVKSFRRLAKKFHPDINKSMDATAQFREVFEAYEILIDDEKRKLYDQILGQQNDFDKNYELSKYSEWARTAQSNAKVYASLKYKDFFYWLLKQSAEVSASVVSSIVGLISYAVRYIVFMTLSLTELILVVFIGVLSPILSFNLSPIIGLGNLAVSILFFVFYSRTKKGYGHFWLYLIGGTSKIGLMSFVFLIFLGYSIVITNLSLIERKNKLAIKAQAFQNSIKDLNTHIDEYTQEFRQAKNNPERIKAPIVVVHMPTKTIDNLFKELPDSIITYRHTDVRTIIQLWRSERSVGHYQNGGSAIQRSCIYKIIDFESSQCIESDTLIGSEPPYVINHQGNGYGSDPIDMLKEILNARLQFQLLL